MNILWLLLLLLLIKSNSKVVSNYNIHSNYSFDIDPTLLYQRECARTNNIVAMTVNELNSAYISLLSSSVSYLQYEKPDILLSLPSELSFELEAVDIIERKQLEIQRKKCLRRLKVKQLTANVHNKIKKSKWKMQNVLNAIVTPIRTKYHSYVSNIKNRFINSMTTPSSPQFNNTKTVKKTSNLSKRNLTIPNNNCLQSGIKAVHYHINYYFADFHEGKWHDTEVMFASNKNGIIIAFRGSDSAADLVTNSQRMESVKNSNKFNQFEGRILRGIHNAYAKVDSGMIIRVPQLSNTSNSKASLWNRILRNNKLSYSHDKLIAGVYQQCLISNTNTTARRKRLFGKRRSVASSSIHHCSVAGVNLSELLVRTVLHVIDHGGDVLITGHSLGGALAVQLTIDILVNHAKLYNNSNNKNDIIDDPEDYTYRFRDFSRLYLTTFGEPEFADSKFFDSVFTLSQEAEYFFSNQYLRFVSVSKYPDCKPDVVTKLLSKLSRVLGDNIVGITRYNKNKKKSKKVPNRHDNTTAISNDSAKLVVKSVQNDSVSILHSNNSSSKDKSSNLNQANENHRNILLHSNNDSKRIVHDVIHSRQITVASGWAVSSIDAHNLNHYLHGLLFSAIKIVPRSPKRDPQSKAAHGSRYSEYSVASPDIALDWWWNAYHYHYGSNGTAYIDAIANATDNAAYLFDHYSLQSFHLSTSIPHSVARHLQLLLPKQYHNSTTDMVNDTDGAGNAASLSYRFHNAVMTGYQLIAIQ